MAEANIQVWGDSKFKTEAEQLVSGIRLDFCGGDGASKRLISTVKLWE